MILAREEVVGALLGLMVELQGSEPRYLLGPESVDDALRRERPRTVVIDCDYPDCSETLLQAIQRSGARPVLFSPYRMQAELEKVASRFGVTSFTLPTDSERFSRMLQ